MRRRAPRGGFFERPEVEAALGLAVGVQRLEARHERVGVVEPERAVAVQRGARGVDVGNAEPAGLVPEVLRVVHVEAPEERLVHLGRGRDRAHVDDPPERLARSLEPGRQLFDVERFPKSRRACSGRLVNASL